MRSDNLDISNRETAAPGKMNHAAITGFQGSGVIIVFVELYGSSRWSFGPRPAWESIETTTIGKTHPTLVSMIASIFLYKLEPIPCEA